jgi:chloramphenicol O-acetyltransferase type A
MKAEFHAIDMETWPRAQTYNYFTEMVTTVTILRRILKSKKIKFFTTYLYLITRAIGKQQEFRMALQDGVRVLGLFVAVLPSAS